MCSQIPCFGLKIKGFGLKIKVNFKSTIFFAVVLILSYNSHALDIPPLPLLKSFAVSTLGNEFAFILGSCERKWICKEVSCPFGMGCSRTCYKYCYNGRCEVISKGGEYYDVCYTWDCEDSLKLGIVNNLKLKILPLKEFWPFDRKKGWWNLSWIEFLGEYIVLVGGKGQLSLSSSELGQALGILTSEGEYLKTITFPEGYLSLNLVKENGKIFLRIMSRAYDKFAFIDEGLSIKEYSIYYFPTVDWGPELVVLDLKDNKILFWDIKGRLILLSFESEESKLELIKSFDNISISKVVHPAFILDDVIIVQTSEGTKLLSIKDGEIANITGIKVGSEEYIIEELLSVISNEQILVIVEEVYNANKYLALFNIKNLELKFLNLDEESVIKGKVEVDTDKENVFLSYMVSNCEIKVFRFDIEKFTKIFTLNFCDGSIE